MAAARNDALRTGSRRATIAAAFAASLLAAACEPAPSDRVQGYVEGEFVYVASPLAGELEHLAVERGAQVKKGDLLFALECAAETAERDAALGRLAQSRADLENARKGARPSEIDSLAAQLQQVKASLALAEVELARQEKLVASNASSATDLDRARSAREQDLGRVAQLEADLQTARLGAREDVVAAAEAEVKAREAALAKAEWDLAQKQQTAEQDGAVFDTLYREGEWVAAGKPVVVLLPPPNVKVRAFVKQALVATIHAGDRVRVFVDGTPEPVLGRVTFISPQVEYTPPVIYSQESREKLVVMIEARFDDATAARLHPGQPVDVAFGRSTTGMDDGLAIDVKGMTKSFGGRVVVDHIDLKVRRGEVCGFLGPNGSGKTTFIRMLCGLLRADAGSGTCLGFDVVRDSEEIKRQVGYMTQRFSFWEDLSIRENLDFVARMYATRNRRSVVRESIARLGLTERQTQLAGELSGGWKQRLALAACLIHEPKLLLLDEPTAGVDPKARRDFWEQIHRLASDGMTVLITTHYMDEAERCHRLAYIAYGSLLASGTVQEVVDQAKLTTWSVSGPDLPRLAETLRVHAGVQQAVPFGAALHVSGDDAALLEEAIAPHRTAPFEWTRVRSGLEDVFIHLMERSRDNFSP